MLLLKLLQLLSSLTSVLVLPLHTLLFPLSTTSVFSPVFALPPALPDASFLADKLFSLPN
ncbi:hypothetical protein HanXRQr2_Chr05g0234481 [Helianthus annuus]|uniref:Secreted protein n=1 Tax=Helianthus annuus TaxID=4232 RepID=A0A9K3J2D8_HELAN|nr:hypothetical protein HanXRQr2_Chr05g0234481 [Helianthus annuus]